MLTLYPLFVYGVMLSIKPTHCYIFNARITTNTKIEPNYTITNFEVQSKSIYPHEDYGKHDECDRKCEVGEEPKTCYFKFNIEWYFSMSKACFDCPFNISDCKSKDCVVANGRKRMISVINRQLPGPSIQVCHNDRIIVDLKNNLASSGTTIHWHGLHQKETPYMDGTPFVTQCPIQPESSFRYDFKATEIGTHLYHSHIGLQRADGAFGPFIVRQPKALDPHRELYDFDLSEHVMIINDWTYRPAMSAYIDHYHSSGENLPESLLINGVGRFTVNVENRTAVTNTAVFEVEKGYKYRFRLINAEFLTCPVELSVDGHNITVIASDGSDIQPITVGALVSFAGERFDFIINADQEIRSYWIKVRGLLVCSELSGAKQVAILRYKGSGEEPYGMPDWDARPSGVVLNPANQGEEQDSKITISKTRSLLGYDERLKPEPDYKLFIGYDLNSVNNSVYHREPYAFNEVQEKYRVYSPQFNHITMEMPKSPLLISRPPSTSFCNSTTKDDCVRNFCICPHVLSVKLNSIVELILVDQGKDFSANHPFHLHGFTFRVLGQYRVNESTTTEAVEKMDRLGLLKRNFENSPIKDTLSVADGGYAIIRFQANNPGYWLFHCHIEFHAELGMALVFKVGEHKDMMPVPENFPNCGDYGL